MELQVWALERVGGAVDARPAAVAEALAELVMTIPPGAPPELVALTACAAALPEKTSIGTGHGGFSTRAGASMEGEGDPGRRGGFAGSVGNT